LVKLDGVFLDMYGTLTAGDRAAVESVCQEIVTLTGVPISAVELSVRWGVRYFEALECCNEAQFCTLFEVEARTLRETMRELGVELDPYPYARELTAYWRNPPLHPEVHEFLAGFSLPICIVSNADRADIEAALARHSIEVAHIVTSEDVRCYKPASRIFAEALRRTGWPRERVIHVGDSLHSDVGGAIAAGLRSGWLNRAHRIHDVGHHTPDHEFEDLRGLTALVEKC
jgi:2-haloacid dehalogenase